MKRQRGGALFDVLLYAAIAAAGFGLLAWGNNVLKHHYIDPVVSEHAPLMRACNELNAGKKATPAWCADAVRVLVADKNKCLAAYKSLDGQFETFRTMHDAQIKAQVDLDIKQRGARTAREKEIAPRLAENATEYASLVASIKAAQGGVSCEQFDAMALEEAKRRQKYYATLLNVSVPDAPVPGVRVGTEPTPSPVITTPPPTSRTRPPNPLMRTTP